ncbi:MAG TPA: TIM barrel protein [Gaiellaceae bacterium]
MTRTVLLSTGAMTRDPIQTDHREIVRHGPSLGVPGFELGIYSAWYGHLDEVIADLRESGLAFPVVHAEKLIGAGLGSDAADEVDDALERLEVNCRAAAALGARTLVLHLWERPTGDRDIQRNLERLPLCLDTAAAYGVVVAAETIPGDVGTPLANLRLALERDARCRIVLDTEFLGFHGQLEESVTADWLWEGNVVHHVHVKDFDGRLWHEGKRRYLLPGEGNLDLQGFLTGLVRRGYAGSLTLEATAVDDEGGLDPARLAQMAAVVNQLAS